MKEAKEWCTQYEEALREECIKAIQLDAMKAGMKRAANLVISRNTVDEPTGFDRPIIEKRILSDAQKLTVKDL